MLKFGLICVVICDVVSVVSIVILFLSWLRTSSCRADLLLLVLSVAKMGTSLSCDLIWSAMIWYCSASMADALLTAIAFASSCAPVMLARLVAILAETGVRVCIVFVFVVVE